MVFVLVVLMMKMAGNVFAPQSATCEQPPEDYTLDPLVTDP